MPRDRDPFSFALESLRDRAMQAVYAPGSAVVIVEEARRLRLSTTPVREALAWLCGEGLMERAPRAGYLAPRLDAALLRDRLWVRYQYLALSLDLTAGLQSSPSEPGLSGAAAVRDLFDRLVKATGNHALIDAFGRVDAQLRSLGDAERRLFDDLAAEADELVRIQTVGSQTQWRTAIDAYHRRRIESAALLVLELDRPGPRPAETG